MVCLCGLLFGGLNRIFVFRESNNAQIVDDQDSEEEEIDLFAEPENECEGFIMGEMDPILCGLKVYRLIAPSMCLYAAKTS